MTDSDRLNEQTARIQEVADQTGLAIEEIADRIVIKRDTMRKYAKGYQPAGERIMKMIEQLPLQLSRERASNPDPALSYGSDPRSVLKSARESKALSHEQLAKISRVPAQYIRDVESGAVRGSNEKQLRKLAKALDLDADALMQGSDHPPIVGAGRTFGAEPNVHTTAGIQARTIPLISMAQAGQMSKASFDDVYDHEGVIDYAKKGRKTFAIRIRGDSMEPRYPEGTIAIVEPEKPLLNERLVIAKLREGGVVFKRLQFNGELFRLISLNQRYEAIPARQQDIEWIYRVVRTQTEED